MVLDGFGGVLPRSRCAARKADVQSSKYHTINVSQYLQSFKSSPPKLWES